MSESSDPSSSENSPADPAAAQPARAPLPSTPRVPIGPRVNPPNIGDARGAGPSINLNELVNLAKNLSDPKATAQSALNSRSLLPKEQKKFYRQENKPKIEPASDLALDSPEAFASAEVAVEPVETPSAPAPEDISAASAAPTAAPTSQRKKSIPASPQSLNRHSTRRGHRFPLAPFLLGQAVLFALLLAGWQALRRTPTYSAETAETAASPGKRANASAPSSQMTAELIDRMMEAEKAGDYKKALTLAEQVRVSDSHVPGLDQRMAQIAYNANDGNAAMLAINRSLGKGEDMAECYILRAAYGMRQGKIDHAVQEYELAAQNAPFASKPFFYWGEALRRLGQPQAALTRLSQAVNRARNPEEDAIYRFKMRLTLIELNREQDFANEMKVNFAMNPPPPEWLMTAAAQSLHRGNYAEAASYLDRTAQAIPPVLMESWLRDYYIFGFAYQKELNRFYAPLLAAAAAASATAASPPPAATPTPAPGDMPEMKLQVGQRPDSLPIAPPAGQDAVAPLGPVSLPSVRPSPAASPRNK